MYIYIELKLKVMFKLRQNTPTSGDCTAGYEVILDKEYTVSEFIDSVLTKSGDWGSIGIFSEKQSWFESGAPYCEYEYGDLKSEMPDDFKNKKVISVSAHGGWSCMDYKIKLS